MPSNDNNLLIMVLQIMPFMITKYNISLYVWGCCLDRREQLLTMSKNQINIYLIGVCYISAHNKYLAEYHTIKVTHKLVTKENWIETQKEKKLVWRWRIEPVKSEPPFTSAQQKSASA